MCVLIVGYFLMIFLGLCHQNKWFGGDPIRWLLTTEVPLPSSFQPQQPGDLGSSSNPFQVAGLITVICFLVFLCTPAAKQTMREATGTDRLWWDYRRKRWV